MLADFFKKDATAYPSGLKSLGDKSRSTAYSRTLSKAGMFVTAVAMAASLTACGPSRAEIEAMKNAVPDSTKTELIAKCDSSILASIDIAFADGGKNGNSNLSPFGFVLNPETGEKMANSVMNGFNAARKQMYDTIPAPSKRTGEHYVLIDYMNDCSDKAVGSKSELKMCMTQGKIKMRPVIVYYGKPEFYQELAEKVKANQMQKTAFQVKTRQQSER